MRTEVPDETRKVPLARLEVAKKESGQSGRSAAGNGSAARTGGPAAQSVKARKTSGVKRRAGGVEREFMPAALEILETPASPAGRLISLTIMAAFVLALAWAYFGRIDIVATAPGRVVPLGGTKLVQARAISTVQAIHVADGMQVQAGDVLIELDDTESEVDIDQLLRQREEAFLEAARLESYIRAVNGKDFSFSPAREDLDPDLVAMQRNKLASDLASFRAKTGSLQAERDQRLASIATIRAELDKLTELRPLVVEREATMHKLMEQGHTPKPVWQQIKAQLIEVGHDLTIKTHLIHEAENGLQAAERQLEGFVADTLQSAYAKLVEAKAVSASADLALRKAQKREELQTLRAPVSGIVHRMAVNTVGGVVRPADPLMVIVPADTALEVRAQLFNRDKSVVTVGTPVEIKFESFDFTRYGTIKGKVVSISNDAIETEGLGLVYDTRVSLEQDAIKIDGNPVPIAPGMTVTAEFKTGTRRVIDFLLSPLIRYQQEAIRER